MIYNSSLKLCIVTNVLNFTSVKFNKFFFCTIHDCLTFVGIDLLCYLQNHYVKSLLQFQHFIPRIVKIKPL